MIKLFLKGFFMGVCDAIPGVSGGTIAFITGIYYRLIESIKNFSLLPVFVFDKMFGKTEVSFRSFLKKADFLFLLVLVFGILTGLFIFSWVVKFLLESYYVYTLAFFVGLIFASSIIVFKNIRNHSFRNQLFAVIGVGVGVLVSVLTPVSVVKPSAYYIFVGGFFGASAMFLPGISGAFILLVLGLYEYMLNVLHNLSQNIFPFVIFVIGFLTGIVLISRLVAFLFKKDRCKTLYFLLGLVVGSLWGPVQVVGENVVLNSLSFFVSLLLFLIGFLIVLIVWGLDKGEELIGDVS